MNTWRCEEDILEECKIDICDKKFFKTTSKHAELNIWKELLQEANNK